MADSLTEDENVMSMFDMDSVSSLLSTDYLYLVRGTGALRDKYTTALAILNYICSNAHTLHYLHITDAPSVGYALQVDGPTYLSGDVEIDGESCDIISSEIYLRGVTTAGKLTVSDTESVYALEVTGDAKFNGKIFADDLAVFNCGVTSNGDVNATGHNVRSSTVQSSSNLRNNVHQAGSGDGIQFAATAASVSVKDDAGADILKVDANGTHVSGNMDVDFSSGVGSFKVNDGAFSVSVSTDISGTMYKEVSVGTGYTFYAEQAIFSGRVYADRQVHTIKSITSDFNVSNISPISLHTTGTKVVIYNNNTTAPTSTITLDSSGSHVSIRNANAMELICISGDGSSNTSSVWRPVNGNIAVN